MAKDTSGNKRIAVIGAGHMGSALLRGLRAHKHQVIASDISKHNARAARSAGTIFVAVKPSVVQTVLQDIKDVTKGKLVVSLAAGVKVSAIRKILGRDVQIARIMPNLAVADGNGVVGLYVENMSARTRLKKLVRSLGLVLEVKKEKDLDAITLIAGCGPGIVASFVDMLARRASALGISRDAEKLALQTFMGTIHSLARSGVSASELVKSVATKGGVTEAILKELKRAGFEKAFARAIKSGQLKLKQIRA